MENHEFALEMQQKFVADVEREKPRYVVFVNVPTTWLFRQNSHRYLFKWFDGYQRDNLELVGTVELYEDHSDYHWEPNVKWPVNSPYWMAIFRDRRHQ
jgi:hypothetical protein